MRSLLSASIILLQVLAGPGPKSVAFQFRNAQWVTVLEWLSDQTGKPVIAREKPIGRFTFVDPKNNKRTLPEIVRILRTELLKQDLLLIQRPRSFTFVRVRVF